MGEFDVVAFILQRSVFNRRHLAESVHIQLPNERGEIIVFEITRKNLARETRLIVDVERATGGVPRYQIVARRVVDQSPKLSEKGSDGILRMLLLDMIIQVSVTET